MIPLFLMLGLGAGALTTIAGQGGGLLLMLACSAIVGPHAALAITAPALLLGNVHRSFMLRRHLDRGIAIRMIAGTLPGAALGGLLAGMTPAWALRVVLVLLTTFAIVKALGYLRFRLPNVALPPAGFVLGGLTGTSGGAAILIAPVLLSAGLAGRTFVATTSAIAVAAHIGRVVGYASLGLFSTKLVVPTVCVTAAIFAGNALGAWIHGRMSQRRSSFLEYGTLVVCAGLAVGGLG